VAGAVGVVRGRVVSVGHGVVLPALLAGQEVGQLFFGGAGSHAVFGAVGQLAQGWPVAGGRLRAHGYTQAHSHTSGIQNR
jgi:hypothetical protein